MGFYLGKSLKAGPFRLNLSTSGIGVSAGIPGFRVGAGPRSSYVRVGAGGVYYRTSLSGGRRPNPPAAKRLRAKAGPGHPNPDGVELEETEGVGISALVPTGPGSLVADLNQAAQTLPWALILGIAIFGIFTINPLVGAIVLVVSSPGLVWLRLRGQAKRSVVSFYEVDGPPADWFDRLVGESSTYGGAHKLWRIVAEGQLHGTRQYKVNAGAGKSVRRRPVKYGTSGPRNLVTNVTVPTFTDGRNSLSFLPDRILVKTGRQYSDVSYSQLKTSGTAQRFIESGLVPSDAQQVGTTWQYVNVRGGPDRRYKSNPTRRIMLYSELELISETGLRWVFQSSRPDVAGPTARMLNASPNKELDNISKALD